MIDQGTCNYPSITGGDLYTCTKTWSAAQALLRIPGRLLPQVIESIWEKVDAVFDMKDHQPTGNHVFARMAAIQRLVIDIQNRLVAQQDRMIEELSALCKQRFPELTMTSLT